MPCPGSHRPPERIPTGIVHPWRSWRCSICKKELDEFPAGKVPTLYQQGAQLLCVEHGETLVDSPWIASLDDLAAMP